MNRIASYFIPLLIVASISSCSPVSGQDAKKIAANFSKDVVPKDLSKYSVATFAGGCFWHEETLYESVKGVICAVSGYAGGRTTNPTYEDVGTGSTGHAETVNVYYDSSKITYPQLVNIYFQSQEDPTQVNGQGPDEGTQYRSIIFYRNNTEKAIADRNIAELTKSGKYKRQIAAQVVPFTKFWDAEGYHQNYINTNTDNPYVMNVSIRDIAHYQAQHPEMIKPGHNFAAK
jgi:peptide-methionine (S)-S-oxide reductase